MKTMKKLFSIVLVLALVLSLGISAMAATITVQPKDTDTVNHEYKAYQIFKGTQKEDSTDDNPLGDLDWGKEVTDVRNFVKDLIETTDETLQGVFANIQYQDMNKGEKEEVDFPTTSDEVAKNIARVLYANETNGALLDAFAKFAESHVNTDSPSATVYSIPGEGQSNSATVDPGYYLIVDTTDDGLINPTEPQGSTGRNKTMLQVTDKVEITVKYDLPQPEKKVLDTNDSEDLPIVDIRPSGNDTNHSDWKDSADHDIGDAVNFQISATLPTDLTTNYTEYTLIFHDKEGKGLTFDPNSVKVYVDGIELTNTSLYTVSTTVFDDGCTFEVTFNDVKKIEGIHDSSRIDVVYTSTLNNNAEIGYTGNPNEMYLEFTNTSDNTGKGKTPKDKVIVFTYKLDVNKVTTGATGENNVPLKGAGFALYKKLDEKYVRKTDDKIVYVDPNTGKTNDTPLDDYVKCVEVKLTKNNDGTIFTGNGVDDGDYILVETKTPPGYNSIDPIEFTVDATHDEVSDDPKLTKLKVKNGADDLSDGENPAFEVELTTDEDESKLPTGNMSTDVVNNEGLQLPETGGIGTTILYVVGGVLVAVAVIFLITKKRMGKAQR